MGHVVFVLLQQRAVNVDLQTDATLQVDISDALSERDKVKFTVHTKVRGGAGHGGGRGLCPLTSHEVSRGAPPTKL